MKLLHLADLHIGKMLYGYSLIEDQKAVFLEVYRFIEEEKIDVVLLAGDIYDRAVPSVEAVNLLNEFLDYLINESKVKVLMISGNHDSSARLNFTSTILEKRGLYIVSCVTPTIKVVDFQDDYGPVHFYLLPFFKKTDLKEILGIEDRNISLNELLKQYLDKQEINTNERNVLVTHTTCISQELQEGEIGTIEWVSPDLFKDFDFVALGHLHGYHQVSKAHIYYAGSPLRLSIDEVGQKKGFLLAEIKDKGFMQVERVDIPWLRELVIIEDTLENLLKSPGCNDYVFVKLLDATPQLNAADRLRDIYPYFLGLTYSQLEKLNSHHLTHEIKTLSELSPFELFTSFYEEMTGTTLTSVHHQLFETYFKGDNSDEN